jgi:regulator of sigma E protease
MLMSTAAFIVVFTVVVLMHELGHFPAARRAGVKVYEFSIGKGGAYGTF